MHSSGVGGALSAVCIILSLLNSSQELKGGGAKVKYVRAHVKISPLAIGILKGMPNWEGESYRTSIKSITVAHKGSWERICFLRTERGRK